MRGYIKIKKLLETYYGFCLLLLALLAMAGCQKALDTRLDAKVTDEVLNSSNTAFINLGYSAYTKLQSGFYIIDNNLMASVTDDAEQTAPVSNSRKFNDGSWDAFINPLDVYSYLYEGIYFANYFLENSVNYREILSRNRDTLGTDNGAAYQRQLRTVGLLRAENRVLRAYFYFELIKRYGGVPLVKKVLSNTDETKIPKASYEDVVNFIVSEIDYVKDSLLTDWSADNAQTGRITKGAALAIKARALLYSASPLHNPDNNVAKWEAAAAAAYALIQPGLYSLSTDYRNLFLSENTIKSSETIWALNLGSTNDLEKKNYPVGTKGGNSGVTPSQNLVDEYEYKGASDSNNPYANRDPRFAFSIVANNSTWTGRTMQIYAGGTDDPANPNTSRTGYYLKKFLNDNLNLVQNEKRLRSWMFFRYAEVLLNYAEAMNEAYGPDGAGSYTMTARQAVNMVRSRQGVQMPAVVAATQAEMRDKIKHERRIELAFEGHRWWDLTRWKDAEVKLNEPLRGVRVINNGVFTYNYFDVESRVFQAPKMFLFPFPQSEILKNKGILIQNPGW